MTATQSQVELAARMYEMRDAAKTLLGARYPEVMAELGKLLQLIAEKRQVDALQALAIAARIESNPFNIIQFTAAAVELLEPST